MSSDKQSRVAKSSSSPNPAPPGDHRKRRRNRTTQSCLNCHASKRMCDRKRPACQRCTTLGLTGLCVYEVDDPSQRDNFLDEKALLRSRVAELEGVIRELKNKPHPRWAQRPDMIRTNSAERSDDGHSLVAQPSPNDNQLRNEDERIPAPEQPSGSSEDANSLRLTVPGIRLTPVNGTLSAGAVSSCESLLSPQDPNFLSAFSIPSPASASSSSSSSPIPGPNSLPQVFINDASTMGNGEFNVESLLANASLDPSGFEEGLYGQMLDHIMRVDQAKADQMYNYGMNDRSQPNCTCGCINNPMAYNNIIELSVRLRKAVEALTRIVEHRERSMDCELYSKVCDLDKFTSSVIGNTTSPTDSLSPHALHAMNGFISAPHPTHPASISPLHLNGLSQPQWEPTQLRSNVHESPEDDAFMTWDGGRRQEW